MLTGVSGEHQATAPLAPFLAEVVDEPLFLGVEDALVEVFGLGDLDALHFAVSVPHECLQRAEAEGMVRIDQQRIEHEAGDAGPWIWDIRAGRP